MSVFGNFAPEQVVDAAEKVISKMDEGALAAAIEQGQRTMSEDAKRELVEAVFDAFRQRGESSEDAAEGAGTSVDALHDGDSAALGKLLQYTRTNRGLLKEATVALIERRPDLLSALPADITAAVRERLLER